VMSTGPRSSRESYYSDNYVDYAKQNPPPKIRFYLDLVERWVEKGQRIFELGVGLGLFLERATERFACQGCDINSYAIGVTHEKLPELFVVEGSYECIPTTPPPKAVVCWDSLEHLLDLDSALKSIFSKLPQGGYLIGMVPVYDGALGWLVYNLDKDPTHVTKISRQPSEPHCLPYYNATPPAPLSPLTSSNCTSSLSNSPPLSLRCTHVIALGDLLA